MKKILFPINLKDPNKISFFYALKYARKYTAELVILNNINFVENESKADLNARIKRSWARLANVILVLKTEFIDGHAKIDNRLDFKIEYRIEVGEVWDEINYLVNKETFDLIILSKQKTLTGLKKLLHKSNVNCLVITEQTQYKTINKITCAIDIDEDNDVVDIAKFIDKMASKFIADQNYIYINAGLSNKEESIQNEFEYLMDKANVAKAKLMIYNADHVGPGVINYIEDNKTDLLILLKQERNYISKFFHDSLTHYILENANTPIFILA